MIESADAPCFTLPETNPATRTHRLPRALRRRCNPYTLHPQLQTTHPKLEPLTQLGVRLEAVQGMVSEEATLLRERMQDMQARAPHTPCTSRALLLKLDAAVTSRSFNDVGFSLSRRSHNRRRATLNYTT